MSFGNSVPKLIGSGDLNTRCFHVLGSSRTKVNRIEKLSDEVGVECRLFNGLQHIARDYFASLFHRSSGVRSTIINLVPGSITVEDDVLLTMPFFYDEFKSATFSMQANKCPSSYGFNPGFYQHFGTHVRVICIKLDVSNSHVGAFPPHVNSTSITLFPKSDVQVSMKDG